MKRKLTYFSVCTLFVLFLGYGCSDDNYLRDYEIQQMIDNSLNGQWQIIPKEVRRTDWTWNNNAGQYEVVFELPQLTQDIYEGGAILGYLFLGQQGVDEVQKTLPFSFTYREEGVPEPYTETISFDVEYRSNGQSTIAFFIQPSNLARADQFLADVYNFRIVLIW